MNKTNLGRVTFVSREMYADDIPFSRLDIVPYMGSTFLAVKDCMGVVPGTDPTCWRLLAKKGEASWADMTDEEKTQVAQELMELLYGETLTPSILTQSQWDNLAVKDPNTMYYVLED